MSKKYQAQQPQKETMTLETKLPVARSVANYYRQSTDEQVGNLSTTIQNVDMPNYMERLGWKREDIIIIDVDERERGDFKLYVMEHVLL